MAINFASHSALADDGPEDGMLAEINTTPLVDVMLVLLIIFLITIPVVNATVAVRLPRESNVLRPGHAGVVVISVDAQGDTYWHDAKLGNSAVPEGVMLALRERLARAARDGVPAEVHIRGDAGAHYAAVARVVRACQIAGVTRIGFITEPTS